MFVHLIDSAMPAYNWRSLYSRLNRIHPMRLRKMAATALMRLKQAVQEADCLGQWDLLDQFASNGRLHLESRAPSRHWQKRWRNFGLRASSCTAQRQCQFVGIC